MMGQSISVFFFNVLHKTSFINADVSNKFMTCNTLSDSARFGYKASIKPNAALGSLIRILIKLFGNT